MAGTDTAQEGGQRAAGRGWQAAGPVPGVQAGAMGPSPSQAAWLLSAGTVVLSAGLAVE